METPLCMARRLGRTTVAALLANALLAPLKAGCDAAAPQPSSSEEQARPACAACGRRPGDGDAAPLRRCTRCSRVFFCDEACLKRGWKAHRKECAAPEAA